MCYHDWELMNSCSLLKDINLHILQKPDSHIKHQKATAGHIEWNLQSSTAIRSKLIRDLFRHHLSVLGNVSTVHLDLTKSSSTQQWAIGTNQQPLSTYTNWHPNSTYDQVNGGDCAYLNVADGMWHDGSCVSGRPYVCQGECLVDSRLTPFAIVVI